MNLNNERAFKIFRYKTFLNHLLLWLVHYKTRYTSYLSCFLEFSGPLFRCESDSLRSLHVPTLRKFIHIYIFKTYNITIKDSNKIISQTESHWIRSNSWNKFVLYLVLGYLKYFPFPFSPSLEIAVPRVMSLHFIPHPIVISCYCLFSLNFRHSKDCWNLWTTKIH